jgi:uncharacterized membrane protein
MPEFYGVPLHPLLAHFPIAAAVFAAMAFLVAVLRPEEGAWRNGGTLLLAVALLLVPLMVLTGRAWGLGLGMLREGAWLPDASVEGGVFRSHVLLGTAGGLAALAAFPIAWRGRDPRGSALTAFVASATVAALLLAAGHQGGRMVHRPTAGHISRDRPN